MSYTPTPEQRAHMSRVLKEKTYIRTPEHRDLMSAVKTGKPHYWKSGNANTPAKIAAWWTPERRERKRQQMIKPNTTYFGLTSTQRAEMVRQAGKCSRCGNNGSISRLDVHHIDRNKQNQTPSNLEVLCHKCHFQEHRNEIGWAVYWRNKRQK